MGNLIIKNNNITKTYECKSTHTGKPYLQVNKNSYLDLTTNTINGLHLQVKYCSDTANQTNTTIKTRTSQEEYKITTGYEGYISSTKEILTTTGYRGLTTSSNAVYFTGVVRKSYSQTLTLTWNGANFTPADGVTLPDVKYNLQSEKTSSSLITSRSSVSNMNYYTMRWGGTGTSSTNSTLTYDCYIATGNSYTYKAFNAGDTSITLSGPTGVLAANPTNRTAYTIQGNIRTNELVYNFNKSNMTITTFDGYYNFKNTTSARYAASLIGKAYCNYYTESSKATSSKSLLTVSTVINKSSGANFTAEEVLIANTTTTFNAYTTSSSTISSLINTTALTQQSTSIANYTITDYLYDIYRPVMTSTSGISSSNQYTVTLGVSGVNTSTNIYETIQGELSSAAGTSSTVQTNGQTISISWPAASLYATLSATSGTYTGTRFLAGAPARKSYALTASSTTTYTTCSSKTINTGTTFYLGMYFRPQNTTGSTGLFTVTTAAYSGVFTARCSPTMITLSGTTNNAAVGYVLTRQSSASARTLRYNNSHYVITKVGTYYSSTLSSTTNSNYTLSSKIITSISSSSSSYSTTTEV